MARFVGAAVLIVRCMLAGGGIAGSAAARTVLDLQPALLDSSMAADLGDGLSGTATLINLNPIIGRWFVLELEAPGRSAERFHLENPFPQTQSIVLDPDRPDGLVIVSGENRHACPLWPLVPGSPLLTARRSGRSFAEICEGRLLLRNPVVGRRTRKEWAADLLRDRVRHGDAITGFIKEKLYRDRYLQTGVRLPRPAPDTQWAGPVDVERGRPTALRVSEGAASVTLRTPELNLVVVTQPGGGFEPGLWYPVDRYPGIFVSVVTPDLVSEEIVELQKGRVNPLDRVESQALVYLVAFDLSRFDLGLAVGTDHPRVGWSDRVPDRSREPALPGPDGFDSVQPLVRTGMLNPGQVERVAATFAGGFKRLHGAFKWGTLAEVNHGSHYGFVEDGVVLSSLNPGLATIVVWDDGQVAMKTWTVEDARRLDHVLHARQSGVPLIEPDPVTGQPRPGAFVRDWGRGNWSGSEQGKLRTLRSALCLQEGWDRRFLVYAYFTSVTPSAMARVLQACDCSYALQLDINAPEHTYLAVYRTEESEFIMQRLVKEMAEVDPPVEGREVPRFIGYPDNRDFFYLLRKAEPDDGFDGGGR